MLAADEALWLLHAYRQALLRRMASAPASKPKYAAALVYHDWLNIIVLPLIFALSVAGLTGILNPVHVSEELSSAPAPAALFQVMRVRRVAVIVLCAGVGSHKTSRHAFRAVGRRVHPCTTTHWLGLEPGGQSA